MSFTLDAFKAQLDNLISAQDSELSDLARYRMIKAAVERYSRDAPDTYSEDEAGDGGKYYDLTGGSAKLANWIEGFSRVTAIQIPAPTVASDEAPEYLEPEDWIDSYWAGGIRYLYLPHHAPAATETMRITFTIPYSWTVSAVTITVAQDSHGLSADDYIYQDNGVYYEAPEQRVATHQVATVPDGDSFTAKILQVSPPPRDFFAICHLAAALSCQAIAVKYSRTSDSSISADSITGHIPRALEFSNRAKEFETRYRQHLGLDADQVQHAAGEFVDMDTAPGWPAGRAYLFHRNR